MARTYEEKKSKFKKLAIKRTNSLFNQLRLIENLKNTYNYSYTDYQVEKIFQAIRDKIAETEEKFKPKKKYKDFTLD